MDTSTIQKRISALEREQEELRISKEMISTELENDPDYQQSLEEVRVALLAKKQKKEAVLASEEMQKIMITIKENIEEINTLKEILNAELLSHHQKTQSDEIIDANGTIRKFKVSVRLLPTKKEKKEKMSQFVKDALAETEQKTNITA